MVRICAKCGAPLEDGSKFCKNCGAAGDGAEELKLIPVEREGATAEKGYIRVSDVDMEETKLIAREAIPSERAYMPASEPMQVQERSQAKPQNECYVAGNGYGSAGKQSGYGQGQTYNSQPAAGRSYYSQNTHGQQHYGQSYEQTSVRRKTSSHRGIKFLLLLIALLLGWNGYMMLEAKMSEPAPAQPVQEVAQVQAEESAKEPEPVQEKTQPEPDAAQVQAQEQERIRMEREAQRRAYIETAAEVIMGAGENELLMESMVESGRHNKKAMLQSIDANIELMHRSQNKFHNNFSTDDQEAAREVEEILSMQAKCNECIRQGIMGDKAQYAAGKRYSQQIGERFGAFRKRYGI